VLQRLRHLDFDPEARSALDAELTEVLAQAGYQEIGAVGEPFDPARHQALAGETRDGRGAVVELYATGLACFGQVAVPAQVRVSSNGPSSEEIKPP